LPASRQPAILRSLTRRNPLGIKNTHVDGLSRMERSFPGNDDTQRHWIEDDQDVGDG
jgi:hypothetical protein